MASYGSKDDTKDSTGFRRTFPYIHRRRILIRKVALQKEKKNSDSGNKVGWKKYSGLLQIQNHSRVTYSNVSSAEKLEVQTILSKNWQGQVVGCDANTLRTAALSMFYATTEYGWPVWPRSSHQQPVLAHIKQSNIRRDWSKVVRNESSPIHQDVIHTYTVWRLKPIWSVHNGNDNHRFDVKEKWNEVWLPHRKICVSNS